MALDPRKRQQKLERKKAKQKATKTRQRERQQLLAPGIPRQLVVAAANCPVHEVHVTRGLFTDGIGYVVLSRRLPLGQIATACFLVDVWCLGVKDLFVRRQTLGEFRGLIQQLDDRQPLRPVSAAYARKLVEASVAYAQGLGLAPHADYAWAQQIFAGIDTAECTEMFQFGHEGKPFYVSGPFDSPDKVRKILGAVGKGELHYLVKVSEVDLGGLTLVQDDLESIDDDAEDGDLESPFGTVLDAVQVRRLTN